MPGSVLHSTWNKEISKTRGPPLKEGYLNLGSQIRLPRGGDTNQCLKGGAELSRPRKCTCKGTVAEKPLKWQCEDTGIC